MEATDFRTSRSASRPLERGIGLRGQARLILQLLEIMRPHYRMLALGISTTILRNVCALGGVMVGAYLVGLSVNGAGIDELRPWLIALGAFVLGRGIAYWLEMWVLHDVAYRILADLRVRLYQALERLAPGYLIDRRSGNLASTAMTDVEAIEIFYAHTLNIFIAAAVVSLGALAILAWIHLALALALLPALVLAALVPLALRRRAASEGRALRDRVGTLNAEVVDAVQGLREIVIFGQGSRRLDQLEDHSQELIDIQLSYGRRKGLESAMLFAVRALGLLSILAVAASLVAGGSLASAYYPLAVVTAVCVFEPLRELNQVAQNLGQTFAAVNRVMAIYNAEPPVKDLVTAPPPGLIQPHIRFNRVSFHYATGSPPALSNASFEIAPGETVALVGRSGAGKSTSANLLLRFWDVTEGAITIGGHDVRSFPQEGLRAMIALVPQDIYLFNVSIQDNIRLGRPEASDTEVEDAARMALADEFIRVLLDGYKTRAGERGVQLSGGQRQRIAIARALLKDAPILIMDEAVSNLDAENERALKRAIERVRAGRTTLTIAHRLSTIRDADRVVVLDQGRVVESGSHEALLTQGSVYADLVASQQHGLL